MTSPIYGDANFADLEKVEFDSVASLFEFAELGRRIASNSGLIIAQSAYDIEVALSMIPRVEGANSRRGARRVSRHAKRAAEHLRAAQFSFGKIPRVFLAEYQKEIQAQRKPARRPFNMAA